ncbi:box C/D snoRNA protein 1 isoform X1 [Gadus morhua]|uniref:BCD1 alpha/beta domain-containing protein n=1 Tax=Gadus morhua TaxID=8049 RepID=A0A8C5FRV1_GADMO|nr:box C/D snoRNA protein 1 isoform X1 [Gadus morhua]XP_030228278.1 box C/D snoRNA protein 1 isoform X1 [Gadus morhua]
MTTGSWRIQHVWLEAPPETTLIRTPHMTFKAKKLTACARKMNITLKFLPVAFTKSRDNSTMFLTKEKRFLWHLELIFPQSNTRFSERRVSDGQTIQQILTSYVHPSKSDPVKRQKLKMYAQTTFDETKVFMKVEGEQANSLRYHELDLGEKPSGPLELQNAHIISSASHSAPE